MLHHLGCLDTKCSGRPSIRDEIRGPVERLIRDLTCFNVAVDTDFLSSSRGSVRGLRGYTPLNYVASPFL